jgi:hypothetical protein
MRTHYKHTPVAQNGMHSAGAVEAPYICVTLHGIFGSLYTTVQLATACMYVLMRSKL